MSCGALDWIDNCPSLGIQKEPLRARTIVEIEQIGQRPGNAARRVLSWLC
jgi:hypothetical protein